MEELTKRQEDTLTAIKKFIATHGYPPTVREIGKILNLSSPATIQVHLNCLADKGYIARGDKRNHTIEWKVENEYAKKEDLAINIPLLGKVTAGSPIEAIENPDEFFTLPTYLIPKGHDVFALNVSGESMINAGIHDGDIVIVEKQNNAHNGEIVVAMNDDNEVTLKTFYKEQDHIRLQPENDTMEPIILKEVTIIGKAIGLYRKL